MIINDTNETDSLLTRRDQFFKVFIFNVYIYV